MSRDGSGNYSLPSGNPVVTGTAVSSTVHNSTNNDIAAALTASIAKDGQTVPTANLPMGTFRHTNVGDASARNHYATVNQTQDNEFSVVASVSGTNSVTGSLVPAITAYTAGMHATITPANNNTGAATLGLNGLTALDILKNDGDALISGDLVAGVPANLILDSGADDWYLLNPQSATLINGVAISDLARLSQANTLTSAATGVVYPVLLSSASPLQAFNETDGASDNRLWDLGAAGEAFLGRARSDDGNTTNNWIAVNRTGATIDSIALTATSITVNGVNVTDFARLSQAATFTGIGSATANTLHLSSTLPMLRMTDTDAATDEKAWQIFVSAGQMTIRASNDDNSLSNNAIVLDRTAATVDSIAMTATTVTVNGVSVRNASILNAGTFNDAQVAASNVTQHQAALSVNADQIVTTVGTTAVGFTIAASHQEDLITATAALTVTAADASASAFAAGDSVAVMRSTTGAVSFAASGTQVIRSPGSRLSIPEQYGTAVITYLGSNVWSLTGV